MSNPLIGPFNTPFNSTPFSSIKADQFVPALKQQIAAAREEIGAIANNEASATFKNTVEALDYTGEEVSRTAEIFFNLNSAETSDEIQEIAREFSPLLTEYGSDVLLNKRLFARIKTVWENCENEDLNAEQLRLLEKTYKSFVRNGALLNDADKEKLRELNTKLATSSLKFGENILAATNNFELVLENEDDLDGLPGFAKEAAAEEATSRGHKGKWVITLDAPSYVPFITYAKKRALREKLSKAFTSRAYNKEENDNQETVLELANLRQQRANLLGYKTHAHFVLEERMAETPEKVESFLADLFTHAKPAAERDLEAVKAFAKQVDELDDVRQWDFAFYAEKLKKERFEIDDELLKPYFKLENVIDGVFEVARRLYGISFEKRQEIDTYHQDVTCYEVLDKDGSHLALFYADFFPRAGKRNGAWMTSYRGQKRKNGENIRPHISIVCNFTKPTASTPSLLTFNEVTTLFHEFGHALHGMLADTTYPSLSGTNVYWDFVELPSQIMENWCFEKECLDIFAKHYQSNEAIPQEYIERLKASATFNEGYATLRQLSFGTLDMAWHNHFNADVNDVGTFENDAIAKTQLFEPIATSNTSCAFSHIFQGGYSSGYYSYKWAEVLDADAFELFKEKGLFDQETATKFRALLAAGGTVHPMELYKRFRGQEPDVKALLRRAGLV